MARLVHASVALPAVIRRARDSSERAGVRQRGVVAAATRQLPGPASEHDPVLAQRRDKNCRAPRSRLSSAASALARSHARHSCTLPYGTPRHGTVRFCTAMASITCTSKRQSPTRILQKKLDDAPS